MHVASSNVLVVGEINPDVIVADPDPVPVFGQVEKLVEEISLRIGSSAAIFACGAARLGLPVAFVGVVGADTFGRFMLEELQAHGVDTSGCSVDESVPTGVSVIHSRGEDRGILTFPGSIGSLTVQQVPGRLIESARHVHVSSFYLLTAARRDLPALFGSAREAGATTSFDCNWDPENRWTDGLEEMLEEADIFFLNAEEARRITGCADEDAAAKALRRRCDLTVVIKRGPDGATTYTDDRAIAARAPDVTPVDCVGAGDTFDAGYLYAWLQGWPPEQALKLAVACGSLSTEGRGGTDAQPTLSEAQEIAHTSVLVSGERETGPGLQRAPSKR